MLTVMDRVNYAFDQMAWVSLHPSLNHLQQWHLYCKLEDYKHMLDNHEARPELVAESLEETLQLFKDCIYGFRSGEHLDEVDFSTIEWM
jgi:hypothetical protein